MSVFNGKQNGSVKVFIISGIAIVLVVIAGIIILTNSLKSVDNKSANESQQTSNATTTGTARGMGTFLQGFSEASADDLKIGDSLVVEGTTNQDGSISANTVYIGSAEDFANISNGARMGFQMNSTNTPPDINTMPNSGQIPGGMPNMPEGFQNMTQEERRQAMEELRNSGSLPDGVVRSRQTAGNASLRGELLNKTDQFLTIKIADGGSKLALYSESTKFMKKE